MINLSRIFAPRAPETVPSKEEMDRTLKESLERGREANRALANVLGWDEAKMDAYFPST